MPATGKKIQDNQERPRARVRLRRILFATDFLPSANAAMPFAVRLADSFGARLYIVHVQEPINYTLPPEARKGVELTRDMEIQGLVQSIHRGCPTLLQPHAIKAEGVVWLAIADVIKKHEIDLVVIGTRGRMGLEKVFLGSQAEEILRHSAVPVLTVGPNVEGPESQRGYLRSICFCY
jgi:nucleotide-binding universal stress UspA family protein